MKKTRNKKIFVLYKNKRRWKEKGKMGGKGEGIRGRENGKKEKGKGKRGKEAGRIGKGKGEREIGKKAGEREGDF